MIKHIKSLMMIFIGVVLCTLFNNIKCTTTIDTDIKSPRNYTIGTDETLSDMIVRTKDGCEISIISTYYSNNPDKLKLVLLDNTTKKYIILEREPKINWQKYTSVRNVLINVKHDLRVYFNDISHDDLSLTSSEKTNIIARN